MCEDDTPFNANIPTICEVNVVTVRFRVKADPVAVSSMHVQFGPGGVMYLDLAAPYW